MLKGPERRFRRDSRETVIENDAEMIHNRPLVNITMSYQLAQRDGGEKK